MPKIHYVSEEPKPGPPSRRIAHDSDFIVAILQLIGWTPHSSQMFGDILIDLVCDGLMISSRGKVPVMLMVNPDTTLVLGRIGGRFIHERNGGPGTNAIRDFLRRQEIDPAIREPWAREGAIQPPPEYHAMAAEG